MAKVIIIGAGNIGKEVRSQLERAGDIILAQADRTLVEFPGKPGKRLIEPGDIDEIIDIVGDVADEADALMLAIRNGNKGADELQYLQSFRSKPIITCAKAAHAYQYPRVLALGRPIGRRAIVGGGTDMLQVLSRRQLHDENLIIHAVINGTNNDVWSTIQQGGSFAGAVARAKKLGYAEPNNEDRIDIVNGEFIDNAMKATIIYNLALTRESPYLTADDFKIVPLRIEDMRRLTSRNARYRYIVTFASVPNFDEVAEDSPGSIRAECGRWRITGGFHDVKAESPWYDWLRQVDGVNNGYTIHNELGQDTGDSHGGPGAGPEVTARAMIRDLRDLVAA